MQGLGFTLNGHSFWVLHISEKDHLNTCTSRTAFSNVVWIYEATCDHEVNASNHSMMATADVWGKLNQSHHNKTCLLPYRRRSDCASAKHLFPCIECMIPLDDISKISKLYLVSVDEQAGLGQLVANPWRHVFSWCGPNIFMHLITIAHEVCPVEQIRWVVDDNLGIIFVSSP